MSAENGSGALRVVVLGSGSRGNAVLLQFDGASLLLDAGFSCRELERRLGLVGCDPGTLTGLVLTHEHGDHAQGADVLVRRRSLPLLASRGTAKAVKLKPEARSRIRPLRSGEPAEIGPFRIDPFSIPHDAAEPLGLVVETDKGHRMGLVSDLGYCSRLAWGRLRDLDVLILETNHDLEMLRRGPYPWSLKQRVAGRLGHLSNGDAADGLPELVEDRLRFLVLYHLSQTNNLPALAAAAAGEQLDALGSQAGVVVADQDEPTSWMEVLK